MTISFKDVFSESPKSLNEYLNGIPRSILLDVSTSLLAFWNKNSAYEHYTDFLGYVFGPDNNVYANEINERLRKFEKETKAELLITNKYSSLRFFEYCFDFATEERFQTNSEAEINILKAYLLLNQDSSSNDEIAGSSSVEEKDLKLSALTMAQSYAYSEIENYNINEVFIAQYVKAYSFFRFLGSHPETQELLVSFLSHFQCASWHEYLNKVVRLVLPIINRKNEGYLDIEIPCDEFFEQNVKFLEQFSIAEVGETISDIDFRKVRTRPLYKVSDGTYRVIFDLFVIEKIFKGLWFQLSAINKKVSCINEMKLRQIYTNDFSEQCMLYGQIESIYHKRFIKFTGEEILDIGYSAEPDYYLRNGNNIFIFESKDVMITSDIKTSYDYSKMREAFKKKLYYDTTKGGKMEKKAVLQLINNIERVLKLEFSFDRNYKSKNVSIYPVIVLHERNFNIVGLNALVNNWFRVELSKLSDQGYYTKKVKPITIIDIDTLILYQDALRVNKFRLEEALDKYIDFCTIQINKSYLNYQHASNQILKPLLPFSIFLSNYLSEKNVFPTPKVFKEMLLSLAPIE